MSASARYGRFLMGKLAEIETEVLETKRKIDESTNQIEKAELYRKLFYLLEVFETVIADIWLRRCCNPEVFL